MWLAKKCIWGEPSLMKPDLWFELTEPLKWQFFITLQSSEQRQKLACAEVNPLQGNLESKPCVMSSGREGFAALRPGLGLPCGLTCSSPTTRVKLGSGPTRAGEEQDAGAGKRCTVERLVSTLKGPRRARSALCLNILNPEARKSAWIQDLGGCGAAGAARE